MGYIEDLRKEVGTRPIIMAGVAVIVLNDSREILLQKRADTRDWGTIGGSLELGESYEEAARRELYEEAGLRTKDLHFRAILSGADMYYQYPHGDEIYNAVVVYEAEGIEGEPQINDDEGLALRYFSLEEPVPDLNEVSVKILKKSGYLNFKQRIELSLDDEKCPFYIEF